MRKLVSSSLSTLPSPEMAAAAGGVALALGGWWEEVNGSPAWQDDAFFSLSAAYALVSTVALVQLIRIQLRVPEFGWTTQKVFHLMNFIVNGVRAVVFGLHAHVFLFQTKVYTLVLLELPGLLFFSTYTLLVLFWAEIYHQAKNLPTALLGFLIYGGRLFFMLRRFPIESKGRRKKLYEVGTVTGICFSCFLIRCIVVAVSSFDTDLSLEVLDHPILDFFYYMLTEILPSALVLFILRKLPPKRVPGQYQPIR